MQPRDAIDVLVTYSRGVSSRDVEPEHILGQLGEVLVREELADAVFIAALPPDGGDPVLLQYGAQVDVAQPDLDELGLELEQAIRREVQDLVGATTLPVVSGGGLFGTVVAVWMEELPGATLLKLVHGLVDVSAVSLDRAYQTRSLQRTVTELEQSREALAHKQKLEALGHMAAVVAHEVKNPLASVSGALQVLSTRMPETTSDGRVVRMLLGRISALARMVDELLVFARPRSPDRIPMPLGRLVHGALDIISEDPRFTEIDVQLDVRDGDHRLLVDPSQLQPVLLNLLINASQAMDGAGSIRVAARHEVGVVKIVVQDSGPGIPADQRARIFEPFFTTKTRGSGLGLAICAQTIEAHGGSIELVDSDRGARFEITLPE